MASQPAALQTTANPQDEHALAMEFLRRFFSGTAKQRSRLVPRAPMTAIQSAALGHGDAFVRRGCVFFLDHYANDESMPVFAQALHDPVDFVRNAALHSLACETCKTSQLCPTEVVPGLVDVLETDPNPEMRTKSIPLLMRLAAADHRVTAALSRAASDDPDELVRRAAQDGLAGRFVAPRKRYERSQRRHARSVRRQPGV